MTRIDNTNKHFKGQLETETVEVFTRKHWIVLVKDFFIFLFFVALLVIAGLYFKTIYSFFAQDSILILILAVGMVGAFTVYIHRFFLRIIRYYLDILIVTNYRIVLLDKSLYLRDSKDGIDLTKIQDIEKQQHGFLRWLFNYGSIQITLSASSTTKLIHFIPNPDYYFRKINKTKREYIKQNISKREKPAGNVFNAQDKPTNETLSQKPAGKTVS